MNNPDTYPLRVVTFEPTRGVSASDRLASARRLLSDLGHSVTETETLRESVAALREEGATDLLVAGVQTDAEALALTAALSDVPVQDRPAHVALITTTTALNHELLRKRLSPTHVHVLPLPIHIHGLLHVIRQLEKGAQMA